MAAIYKPHTLFAFVVLLPSLFFPMGNVKAQTTLLLDSLKIALVTEKDIQNKVDILNDLAWYGRFDHLDTALTYALNAYTLSKQSDYTAGFIVSNDRVGMVYAKKGAFNKAVPYHKKAMELSMEEGNDYAVARAANYLGLAYKGLGQYNLAIPNFQASIERFIRIDYERATAHCYLNMGACYDVLGNDKKTIESYNKALKIYESFEDSIGVANAYQNIGVYHNDNQQFNSAIRFFLKAEKIYLKEEARLDLAKTYYNLGYSYLSLKDYPKALNHFEKSLKLREEIATRDISHVLNSIGLNLLYNKQEDKALEYLKRGLSLSKEENDSTALAESYINLAILYRYQNRFDQSIDANKQALAIARSIADKDKELSALKEISQTYSRNGDLDQYQVHIEDYIELKDFLEKRFREASDVKELYNQQDLDDKDQKIKTIELDKLAAQNMQITILNYALAIGIVLLGGLLFSALRAYRNHRRTVKANQALEQKQKEIEDLLLEQEFKSLGAMIRGQEEERKRIAQDLHDRLGSLLSVVKINFKAINKNIAEIKDENQKQYKQAYDLLDKALDEVRHIAHNMVSGVLKKFGLISALEDMKATIETSELIQIHLNSSGLETNRLDSSLEIAIYRVIQELVSNALKHAEAEELDIQLVKSKDNLNIIVEDDGKGFNFKRKDLEHIKSMGLKNIFARVKELDGEINVDSYPGKGTTVVIDIPLPAESGILQTTTIS